MKNHGFNPPRRLSLLSPRYGSHLRARSEETCIRPQRSPLLSLQLPAERGVIENNEVADNDRVLTITFLANVSFFQVSIPLRNALVDVPGRSHQNTSLVAENYKKRGIKMLT